jgi:hypothetical protein
MQRLKTYAADPKNQFRNAQIPWHFIGYLTEHLSEQDFQNQPTKSLLKTRKLLADAIRADLIGESQSAIRTYREFNATPIHKKDRTPFLQNFINWRIADLSPQVGASPTPSP